MDSLSCKILNKLWSSMAGIWDFFIEQVELGGNSMCSYTMPIIFTGIKESSNFVISKQNDQQAHLL